MDRYSRTPLYLSAQLRYGEATKLLVDRGALVSAVDSSGRTARNLAEEKGRGRATKALDGESLIGYVFEDRFILL